MLKRTLLALAGCLLPVTAMAQMGPQGGGRPGGGGGPPGAQGEGPGRGQPPRVMKPVKREAFDKVVTAMFRSADTNRDGTVTLDELRAIIEARRDTLVRARFAKIDSNRNQAIELNEFLAWQRAMGSVALSENQALAGSGGPVPEVLAPELGEDMDKDGTISMEEMSALEGPDRRRGPGGGSPPSPGAPQGPAPGAQRSD